MSKIDQAMRDEHTAAVAACPTCGHCEPCVERTQVLAKSDAVRHEEHDILAPLLAAARAWHAHRQQHARTTPLSDHEAALATAIIGATALHL